MQLPSKQALNMNVYLIFGFKAHPERLLHPLLYLPRLLHDFLVRLFGQGVLEEVLAR